MHQEWCPVEDFPGYSVSDHGLVRNDIYGNIIARRVNNRGIAYVGLSRASEQTTVSVTRLVANAFLPPHESWAFDTPINLNGDRTDNRVSNLMWRPRWFAVQYQRQFTRGWPAKDDPTQELDTEEVFESSSFAAMRYGLMAIEIYTLAWNYTFHANTWSTIWPTGQRFRSLIEI